MEPPEIRTSLVLRTLCHVPLMLSYSKFTSEMRTPLYTGHFTRFPKVSTIEGFHCIGLGGGVDMIPTNLPDSLLAVCSKQLPPLVYEAKKNWP